MLFIVGLGVWFGRPADDAAVDEGDAGWEEGGDRACGRGGDGVEVEVPWWSCGRGAEGFEGVYYALGCGFGVARRDDGEDVVGLGDEVCVIGEELDSGIESA